MKLTKLIEQRNTGKGNPNAIFQFVRPLNVHQKKLLNQIPSFNSRTMFPKRGVNMKDLSALTAHISYKFAMFMKHNERLIIRGMFTWSALMRKQPVRWLPNGIVGAGIRFRV